MNIRIIISQNARNIFVCRTKLNLTHIKITYRSDGNELNIIPSSGARMTHLNNPPLSLVHVARFQTVPIVFVPLKCLPLASLSRNCTFVKHILLRIQGYIL